MNSIAESATSTSLPTDYAVVKTVSRIISGECVTVDAQDAHLLDEYTWRLSNAGYLIANVGTGKTRRTVGLHSLIKQTPAGLLTDHRDNNPLNNTRDNLRICTPTQNSANRRKSANCSSQYKGVYFNKPADSRARWMAYIVENGRMRNLGFFDDEAEAARAYDREALRLHGDFARLNFPSGS
jgi:hypothetical protein